MNQDRHKRKLTAVFSADVVGYSRLMKTIVLILIILTSSITYARPYESLPSLKQLNADIEKFGAGEVLWDRLWNSDKAFGELIDKVSTGDAAWVAVAVKLNAVSDAGASEGLAIAMSRALVKNPKTVLSVLSSGFNKGLFLIEDICSGNMLYISSTESEIEKWRSEAISAVSGVNNERLKENKAQCIKYLTR